MSDSIFFLIIFVPFFIFWFSVCYLLCFRPEIYLEWFYKRWMRWCGLEIHIVDSKKFKGIFFKYSVFFGVAGGIVLGIAFLGIFL